MSGLRHLLSELRRRRVVQTALIYAAAAWAAIEVVTTLLPVFGGRDTVVRVLVTVILLGLPVAIALSWMFDLSPAGVTRERDPEGAEVRGGLRTPETRDILSRPPPAPTTPLVGRAEEMRRVVELLEGDARAVTLTGPGGAGKTRLAIAVADQLTAAFAGGVAYVELATVTDPDAVIPTMAGALGVKEAGDRSLAQGLVTVIGDRHALVVLDNLEQVVEAAVHLSTLLHSCPGLHLLITSRAPLRLSGEVEVPLGPLALPPPGATPVADELATYGAVELFVERTRRARPEFRLSEANAAAVLAICRRLDGLPLALELAAARLRTLEPEVLVERLDHALSVLTAGARDLPERQRTLRATIDWSHSLLDDDEQRLFRHLSVFAGGWCLEAVGPVCAPGEGDGFLDVFDSLVEKGLVRPPDAGGRFAIFETIREYAGERLDDAGETDRSRDRHAAYFHTLVAALYDDFRNGAQIASLERTDNEAANLEVALERLHGLGLEGDVEAAGRGLAVCGDLWMYWHVRGLHVRARDWSRRFLRLPAAAGLPDERARALLTASVASLTLGDGKTCLAEVDEAESLVDGDAHEVGAALPLSAGVAHLTMGDLESAARSLERSVRRAKAQGLDWELGVALAFKGIVESAWGNAEEARALFDGALTLQRRLEDYEGMGLSLGGLAALEAAAGRPEAALVLYLEAFDAYHAIADRPEEARILDAYAWTALSMDHTDDARENFVASLRAYEEVGSVRGIGLALLGLAATEAAAGHPERAVLIAAAADAFSMQEGVANDYAVDSSAPRYLDPARAALDPERLERLERDGATLSVREAVRFAVERTMEGAGSSGDGYAAMATPR